MLVFFLVSFSTLGSTQAASSTCPPPGPDPKCDEETEILCPGIIRKAGQCPSPAYCISMFDGYDGSYDDNDGNPCVNNCPIQCNVEAKEKMCDITNVNGCPYLDSSYCVPFNKDTNCYEPCPHAPCDEEAGQILCPGGKNPRDGCPIDDYCAYPDGDCPAVCNVPPCNIDAGERICYNERDENGCYTGGYCAVTCND